MKRLFTGKFRGIPVALLTIALLMTIGAGAVLAITNGFELWQGEVEVMIKEPIEARYDSTWASPLPNVLEGTIVFNWDLHAGSTRTCWFSFYNKSGDLDNCLLIKAIADVSQVPAGVRLEWWDEEGLVLLGSTNSEGELITELGIPCGGGTIMPQSTLWVQMRVVADGDATPGAFATAISFTRQSPPTPQP